MILIHYKHLLVLTGIEKVLAEVFSRTSLFSLTKEAMTARSSKTDHVTWDQEDFFLTASGKPVELTNDSNIVHTPSCFQGQFRQHDYII